MATRLHDSGSKPGMLNSICALDLVLRYFKGYLWCFRSIARCCKLQREMSLILVRDLKNTRKSLGETCMQSGKHAAYKKNVKTESIEVRCNGNICAKMA